MNLIKAQDLDEFSRRLKSEGKRSIFTNGCFDLIHPGHLSLLEKASSLGDVLIVGINDDATVKRLKGARRPVFPAGERAEILLSIRWVDYITIFSEDTPLETIQKLRPDVLVKGGEYEEEDIVGAEFVKSYGGEVLRMKMIEGFSSSRIISKIAKIP